MIIKIFICTIIIFLVFISCENESPTESYNYERDTPVWLKTKIDSLVTNDINGNYAGTEVYRYTWNNEYLFDIYIPASMCRYCLLFDEYGNRVYFNTSQEGIDFEKNRKNEILIWKMEN